MELKIKSKSNIKKVLYKHQFNDDLIKKIINYNLYIYENGFYCINLPKEKTSILPLKKTIKIIYEDDYFMIINKEANLDCLPSKRHYEYNLSSMIINYFQENNIYSTIHLVNRLDYKTEGLMIIAKHGYIHRLFENVKITKKYLLLATGALKKKKDLIHIKMKKADDSVKRIISQNGKDAYTKYKVIKTIMDKNLIEVQLLTGRTHQIRLSFSSLNCPLIGDHLYGNAKPEENLCLCAYYLKFKHPITKKKIQIKIEPSFKI